MGTDSGDGVAGKLVDELRQLAGKVEQLEDRVVQLESSSGAAAQFPGPLGLAEPDNTKQQEEVVTKQQEEVVGADASRPGHSSVFLGRVAVVCFVLIGALVLRVVSRAGIIAPGIGTALGLVYCVLLLAVPAMLRRRESTHEPAVAPVLEMCGVMLAGTIVLESAHRGGPLGVGQGAALLAGLSVAVAAFAWLQRLPKLLAVGHLVVLVTAVGLGLTAQALPLRGAAVLVTSGAVLLLARRLRGPWLHAVAMLPVMLVLAGAVLGLARRPETPPEVINLLLMLCAVLWAMTAGHALWSRGEPQGFRRLQLPLVTLWLVVLGLFVHPLPAAICGLALSLVLLTGLVVRGRVAERQDLLAMCAWLPLITAPWVDPSGLSLGALALVHQRLGLRHELPRARILSHFLMLAAVIFYLAGGSLSAGPGGWPLAVRLGVGLFVALFAVLHFAGELWALRRGTALPVWLPALSLTALGGVTLGVIHLAAHAWLGAGSTYSLFMTVTLATLSVVVMVVSRKLAFRPGGVVAMAVIGLLGLKVLARDLVRLEGISLLCSVLALGVAAGIISLLLRSESWREPGGEVEAAEQDTEE